MSAAIIIPIVAVIVGLRLYQRRRKRREPRVSDRSQGDIELVARREIRERIKTRAFRVATVIVLLVVAAAIIIPVLRKGHETTVHVGVVGATTATLHAATREASALAGAKVRLETEANVAKAIGALRSGDVDLVIDHGTRLYVDQALTSSSGGPVATVAEAMASTLGLEAALVRAGLSPNVAARLARPISLPITGLKAAKPHKKTTTVATAIYVLILMYILLTQYGTWILMGIVEEKTSRVVEVLLSAVSPRRLLVGKVSGIGLVALAQAAVIVGFALILAAATGSTLIKGTAPSGVILGLVWLLLGYAFYCWVYAAAGSMLERQDQLQAVALPLQLPILFGYIVGLIAVQSSSPSLFVKVLAYLPPTAPFGMTVLIADNAVAWWQVLVAALLSIAATVLMARFAGTIFRRAILQPSKRLGLADMRRLLGSGARNT
jgi:ABC-2 type transport system permease protein